MLEVVAQDRGYTACGQVAVSYVADLYRRRQCAATEAGDFFDGEQAIGIGVVTFGDIQVAVEGIVNLLGAFNVAGGSDADADDVFAGGLVSELIVECRDAGDGCGCYLGDFADVLKSLSGQETVVVLCRLEDLKDLVGCRTEALDDAVY